MSSDAPLDATVAAVDAASIAIGQLPPGEKKRWRAHLLLAVKFAIAAGLLGWLAYSGKIDLARLAAIPPSPQLGLLVVCVIASMVLPAVRWWWLLRIQGIRQSLWLVARLTWIGYFTGLFLPGAAGGDAAKAYLVVKGRPTGKLRALSTVVVDRYLGLYSLLCLGCVSFALIAAGETGLSGPAGAMAEMTLALWIGMTAGLAFTILEPSQALALKLVPGRWHQTINQSWSMYRSDLRGLANCFLISVAGNFFTLASWSVAAQVLGGDDWATAFLAGPLVGIANCLPISPGGIGVGEAVGERLFASLGSAGGAEVILLVRALTALFTLPAGLWLYTKVDHDESQPSLTGA